MVRGPIAHVSEDRPGEFYTKADGSWVCDEGKKIPRITTGSGQQRAMTFQVAPVHKASRNRRRRRVEDVVYILDMLVVKVSPGRSGGESRVHKTAAVYWC